MAGLAEGRVPAIQIMGAPCSPKRDRWDKPGDDEGESVALPLLPTQSEPYLGRMNHDSYDDGYIRGILNTVKTIAMVGVSANVSRPSYFAFKYLLERRYHMVP